MDDDPTYAARAAAKRLMDQAFHTAGDAEGRARVLTDWETILDALQAADMERAFDQGVTAMSRALQGGPEPVNPWRVVPPGEG